MSTLVNIKKCKCPWSYTA